MKRYSIAIVLLLVFSVSAFAEETEYKETPLKRGTTIFLATVPLTLAYSLLSYRFYKMYRESDFNYSLSARETRNVVYVGVSISLVYSLWDYFKSEGAKKKNAHKSGSGR